jgi:hypothetical protein
MDPSRSSTCVSIGTASLEINSLEKEGAIDSDASWNRA